MVLVARSIFKFTAKVEALDSIEQGQYHLRLPPLDLPEFEAIAQKFNGDGSMPYSDQLQIIMGNEILDGANPEFRRAIRIQVGTA
jgi:hypothetical protein